MLKIRPQQILPVYCAAYSHLVAQSDVLRAEVHVQQRYTWCLQEDNDPSHGTRNCNSLPAVYWYERGVKVLSHPANSPNLNPIEGISNIIKERVKCQLYTINSITELKAALQHEWKQVGVEVVS